ncbi:MurR/RpiR family transcriptional regulator [Gilvimarinus agarilyticus]|uniref:MurR/RpiR family transcriptional regulator n=1 Tax=unclassified Gilvimarinus TaxID=2642066 RepID=UPI001C08C378|nr:MULTISPECIES: MurR/RpiR family transcriptional regulator [unclassified Gilvimarinus]MBU2884512.1 MurR/RpiR family transcriptional regulator [Gilvimarinus agarilyticus]MDO6569641.1 MurR/RpiR family transcriptional regulator [Gilvimarinus sp. 2_MG-2023]MDO6748035.1 MurR/RpiR family transcriptional regulator [Gilvimarinus sp. 1_MG-2023]
MTHDLDIVSRINTLYGQLRDAEQKIAKMILADLQFASQASISDMAAKAGVSEASITRFARAVDCKNVRDLKLRLAQSVAIGQRFYSEPPTELDGKHAVFEAVQVALEHSAALITDAVVEPAVEAMVAARQIVVFGVGGGSTVLAQECQYRLFRLGVSATAYSDPMLMRMAAATLEANDVVICLSAGGYSPDVQAAAEIAREYGAKLVGITVQNSPLGNMVDCLLPIESMETDFIFKPSASRYVMLAALDVLVTELAVRQKRKSRETLRRIKHTLDTHKQGKDRLPLGD